MTERVLVELYRALIHAQLAELRILAEQAELSRDINKALDRQRHRTDKEAPTDD